MFTLDSGSSLPLNEIEGTWMVRRAWFAESPETQDIEEGLG